MSRQIVFEKKLLDSAICMECNILDNGIHVLLVSKRHGHVGAVSHMEPGGELQTIQFPTHKDAVVSELWTRKLCQQLQRPVTVCCGIHYDSITREQIQQIVDCTKEILDELLEEMSRL